MKALGIFDSFIQTIASACGRLLYLLAFLLIGFFVYKLFRIVLGLKVRRRVDRVPGTRCSLPFCSYEELMDMFKEWSAERRNDKWAG